MSETSCGCMTGTLAENTAKENDDIRGIASAIILIASVGLMTKQNPDRVIDDCTHVLETFIAQNFVRLN